MPNRLVTWEMRDTLETPPLNDDRLRTLSLRGWDWLVQTFNPVGEFCMETVHKTDFSKDTELRAIEVLGRTAKVIDLRPYRD